MPPPTAPSPLAARRVAIDTYRENVVYLRRDCPVYRAEGFQALSLSVAVHNRSRMMYQRAGFQRVEERGDHWVMVANL